VGVWTGRARVEVSMTAVLMRAVGPSAYLSAALVLAWSSALVGALAPEAVPTRVVPIPWAGG
jgi:hypothetical protein